MLRMADIIVITKGDIVSQAEREVFAARVHAVNPTAIVMHINGLTGQGTYELSTLLHDETRQLDGLKGKNCVFPCHRHFARIAWAKRVLVNRIKWAT